MADQVHDEIEDEIEDDTARLELIAKTYAGGDFSENTTVETSRDVGDSLFSFIMNECSASEGCENTEAAIYRMETAIREIQEVINALETSLIK